MTELVSVDTSHKFVMRVIVAAAALEANGFKKRDASVHPRCQACV